MSRTIIFSSPVYSRDKPLRAFVFDSWYDHFKGVVAHIAICDGVVKTGWCSSVYNY